MRHAILVRYDEIGIKGKNRPDFVRRLVANIQRATGLSKEEIQVEWGRIYLHPSGDPQGVCERLSRVFGVKSFSVVLAVPHDLDCMREAAVELARRALARGARTFKIEARRSFKAFPLNSMEINRELGHAVSQALPELRVEVRAPEVVLEVEVRKEGVFLGSERIPGPGGLPVGVAGRALLLLSGGIDSPVAGWMLMKRGVAVDAVYFHSPPYVGEKAKEKVLELGRVLARWRAEALTIYVPHFTEIQVEVSRVTPPPLWTILFRRFMHRVAERIAQTYRYGALATGESLGQVASQTMKNLACVDAATRMLVLRPLVGWDKAEIVRLARQIGTYEISILPYEDCCILFAPRHPETHARLERVEAIEAPLDVPRLVKSALERMEIFSVTERDISVVPSPSA
ncbi:MAG: tRNA 4-thiouridine(8) synthase ThiI [Blastocatellia bacterium]|nr:tRNA 4-thiouridine(8) synthase ThiI [Blastocatellia bacterium]MCS7158269.1 tRNA 4-thiouridine(8) synthase ThiI [Blastocatellia bacterium]MCX7753107.1 tRNA 4-thiouridine(8) synthase ThiI [Blastocatellia bacterium]MDW8169421.1 tRNA uracil 4-sulfurtransferase ThiI [Acidobacteriota bacterium]MDW8255696.1 tRNA uracil 4-sulfurtransferase ThiI [Acidobacteriota bacterium]